jgi:phosphoribosyl 1,2-cyclic phosphodiesterase
MKVKFWGVRGFIPAPGDSTVKYGGNTICIEAVSKHDNHVIIDVGTGSRRLGLKMMAEEFGKGRGEALFLISHTHWDHIQGFPFFPPIFIPGNKFEFYGPGTGPNGLEHLLEGQMNPNFNPVHTLGNLGASFNFNKISEKEDEEKADIIHWKDIRVSTIFLDHARPRQVVGYRLEDESGTIAFMTDVCYSNDAEISRAAEFVKGCDVLIHDTAYLDHPEYERIKAQHSSIQTAVKVARQAKVKTLVPFHYPHDADDETLERIFAAQADKNENFKIIPAKEGMIL